MRSSRTNCGGATAADRDGLLIADVAATLRPDCSTVAAFKPKDRPTMCAERSGTLYLVVGPSGAGKDALLGHAGRVLADTHIFQRRVITRRAAAGGENHEAMRSEKRRGGKECVSTGRSRGSPYH